ncbi:MAG: putrescine-ornithine antiporter [Megasphaera sp.]|jgi:putrescine:ornithine antiporter|uniref:putrescine-ornithine antiporter n=1 Tax=Megasphaera sueciensis TaxID=349094 RepID=UPI003D03955E|nr:putrescine-ornithine antiporter [Megasphaera sp.]MCI1823182.1 putrescine-ornithine antiporter [Megasphaera sp.]
MKTVCRKMSVVQLTFVTAANMLGAGIIMLPTKLAQVGTISIISWVITSLGSLALAMTFARCGMFSTKPGGMGGYSEYAFGRIGHFMANYSYAVSIVIANVAIAISAVGYGAEFFSITLTPLQTCIYTISLLWLGAILNFSGTRQSGTRSTITIWGAILPVLGISIIGWYWFDPSLWISAWNPNNVPLSDAIGNSIALTLWSFLGLESAAVNMDAVENPQKNVPIATFVSTVAVAIIYVASTNAIFGIVPNDIILTSNAPFGIAFSYMLGSEIGKIVMGLMVISCAGSLLSWQFTLARVFKTSAERGLFPKIFAKVTNADAPIQGMIIILLMQMCLSLMTMSPTLAAQFELLANLAVVTNIIPYILCAASLKSILTKKHISNKSCNRNLAYFLASISIIYCVYALTTTEEAAFIGGVIAAGIGIVGYAIKFNLHKQPFPIEDHIK